MKALLLSGGMDSSALAFLVRPELAIAIDYGQLGATTELESASRVAAHVGMPLDIVRLDARALGGGLMAGKEPLQSAPCPEWWPYRNQFLITVEAMRAFALGVRELLFAAVASDGEAHSDGRPEFFARMSELLAFQEGGLRVSAPAIAMTTVQLVRESGIPLDLLVATHSCHRGDDACGQCRGCWKREEVLRALGLVKD
jgi:7-cyano-7-deazaguanine synthase